jgi:cytochrome c peroxidase
VQAGTLYPKVITDRDREHLFGNLVAHLRGGQTRLQLRQTAPCDKADPEDGERVAKGLDVNIGEVQRLAALSPEELTGPYMHNGKFPTLEAAVAHYEELAKGTLTPVAGELDSDVRKGTILFGAGGGEADDVANMVEFMKALTGSQLPGPKRGVAPPSPK